MGDRTPVPWRGRLSKAADLSWIHFSIHHRLGCFQKWLDGRTTDFFTSIFLVLLACLPRFACLLAALPRVALPLIDSFLPSFLPFFSRSVGRFHSFIHMYVHLCISLPNYLFKMDLSSCPYSFNSSIINLYILRLYLHPLFL